MTPQQMYTKRPKDIHASPASSHTALVITGGTSPAAYDILRCLGKDGVTVSVASSQSDDMAFYSKFCGEKIVIPDFEEHNFPAILDVIVRRYPVAADRPVLYYTSDPELAFVSRYRKELEARFRFLLPGDEILHAVMNKRLFSEFALEYNLPVPRTITIDHPEDIHAVIDKVEFPCIVKPAFSHDWKWDTEEQQRKYGPYKKALRRCTGREQLIDFCRDLPRRDSGILIQSYIDGRDEAIVSFHGYFDEDSRCLGYFMGDKIRTYPVHTGGSAYVRTIKNDELARDSIMFMKRIGYRGISKIDYKWDEKRAEYLIMEINPRYNLWELLGAFAGMNLALIAYRHQRGETLPEARDYTDDARLLYFKQDLRGYWGGYRKTGEWSLTGYLLSIMHPSFFRVFDADDLRPFVHSFFDFTKRSFLKLMGRWDTDHGRPIAKKHTPGPTRKHAHRQNVHPEGARP